MIQANKIFLGCNYSNRKIKRHFDRLKETWEKNYPLEVIVIDGQTAQGTKDLWKEIQRHIVDCALAILDVSGFKPNVVLELGYALAMKAEHQIVISFDERKRREGRKPEWQLSDIPQLHQVRYKTLDALDEKLLEHIKAMEYMKHLAACHDRFTHDTTVPEKYISASTQVLGAMRDSGALTDTQFQARFAGSSVRKTILGKALKQNHLARRSQGPHGKWTLKTSTST